MCTKSGINGITKRVAAGLSSEGEEQYEYNKKTKNKESDELGLSSKKQQTRMI